MCVRKWKFLLFLYSKKLIYEFFLHRIFIWYTMLSHIHSKRSDRFRHNIFFKSIMWCHSKYKSNRKSIDNKSATEKETNAIRGLTERRNKYFWQSENILNLSLNNQKHTNYIWLIREKIERSFQNGKGKLITRWFCFCSSLKSIIDRDWYRKKIEEKVKTSIFLTHMW